jgi:hypothetical protein
MKAPNKLLKPAINNNAAQIQIPKIFLFLRPLKRVIQYLVALGIATTKINNGPKYKCWIA